MYNIKKYPDNTSYVEVLNKQTKDIIFRINNYEDLWHLNQFIDSYSNLYNETPGILIPNLLDAQADRRFNKNESSGLKLVCNFLNNMNANFKIFHPHNSEVIEALIDNILIINNSYFIKEVLSDIYCENVNIVRDKGLFYHKKDELIDNLILASSDAGGFKTLMKLCDEIKWNGETFSASKSRKYENEKSKLIQLIDKEDFEGKDILIIDDISVFGGTFKGLSKLLREKNCGKLYLAISHMTIQDLGEDSVTNYYDKVFTTNSKYSEYYIDDKLSQPKNLQVINLF